MGVLSNTEEKYILPKGVCLGGFGGGMLKPYNEAGGMVDLIRFDLPKGDKTYVQISHGDDSMKHKVGTLYALSKPLEKMLLRKVQA